MKAKYALAGTVDEVKRAIEQLKTLGGEGDLEWFGWFFDQGFMPWQEEMRQIELFAEHIIPAFRSALPESRRSPQSNRQQVKEAPDQSADQRSVYADVLEVTPDDEFNPVGEAGGIPLPHNLDKELRESSAPGHAFQCHCLDRAIDPLAHCRIGTQMLAERTDRCAERLIDA